MIRGTVDLTAQADDAGGVAKVEFFAGGTPVGTATSAPYTVSWDTTAVPDRTLGIDARITDRAGNVTVTTARMVTVANDSPVDTTPPSVVLTSPAPDDVLNGQVTCGAEASDDDAISYVQFAVDAQLVATTSSAPWEVTLDSSTLPDGPATITATAVDRTGERRHVGPRHRHGANLASDVTPPVSTAACGGTACPTTWVASGQSVRLAALDSGSGVDVIRYTTDGSEPTISHGTTYDSPLSIGSSATVRYRGYDRAGNAEEVHTLELQVDTVAPFPGGHHGAGRGSSRHRHRGDHHVRRRRCRRRAREVLDRRVQELGSRTSAPAMALGHPHRRRGFAHPPGRGARCGRQLPQIPRGHRDRDALIEAGPPAAPPRTRDPACRVSATRRVPT